MRIRFIETRRYATGGPNQGPIFRAGAVYELDEDFARRWLRRRVAEETEDPATASDPREQPDTDADLDGLGFAQLKAIAKAEGVAFRVGMKTADLRLAIAAARAAGGDSDGD